VKAAVGGLLLVSLTLSCARNASGPAALDTRTETCRSCRMPVSDPSLAAQLAAPGEEPRFYDDIGCLRDALAGSSAPAGSTAWVADHRTKEWVRATKAVYTRASIATPMGSHWIAHSSAASRDSDPAARGGTPVSAREIFGEKGAPDG